VIRLTIGVAYYRNAGMLARQYAEWAGYPDHLKAQVEAIVVDDSSPERAEDVPRPDGLPTLRIGRLVDVKNPETPPWRQDAARNRAAYDAVGDWLFLSDMDHVLPATSLAAIFDRCISGPDAVYSFQRLDAPNLTPKLDKQGRLHPHPNTYLMRKSRYWAVGGYDEDFGGIYGTDGPFKKAVLAESAIVHLDDVPIVRYSRDVIPDASTRVDRHAFKDDGRVHRLVAEKRAKNLPRAVLSVPYTLQVSA
jgi:hypothetical protein